MTRKKIRQQSLLNKQRLSKRHKFKFFRSIIKSRKTYKVAIAATLSISCYLYQKEIRTYTASWLQDPLEDINKTITTVPQLTNQQLDLIKVEIEELKNSVSTKHESQLMSIQKKLTAAAVNLLYIQDRSIQLNIVFHKPIAKITSNFGYYLTEKNQLIPTIGIANKSYVTVEGINVPKNLNLKSDRTYDINHQLENLLAETQLLLKASAEINLNFESIHLDEFRGFKVKLKNKNISIELGRAPFKKKFIRVSKIIKELDSKGKTSANIEVDYEGKAFIQELES